MWAVEACMEGGLLVFMCMFVFLCFSLASFLHPAGAWPCRFGGVVLRSNDLWIAMRPRFGPYMHAYKTFARSLWPLLRAQSHGCVEACMRATKLYLQRVAVALGCSSSEVLLMQWNSHFDFNKPEFQFLDLFSGASHTSRVWSCAQPVQFLCAVCPRSKEEGGCPRCPF